MGLSERLAEAAAGVARAAGRVATDLKPYAQGGLIDLQTAVTQAFPDSQHQASVLGMAGVPTPGEVDRDHGGLDARLDAAARPDPDPGRGMER